MYGSYYDMIIMRYLFILFWYDEVMLFLFSFIELFSLVMVLININVIYVILYTSMGCFSRMYNEKKT